MGPFQHPPNEASHQDVFLVGAGRAPRCRTCLLKGCQRFFRPAHPLCRYCSSSCKAAARRWSWWRAGRRYRRSDQGRQCRREQCCRYRERQKLQSAMSPSEPSPCEGHHKQPSPKKSCCSRPGCYVLFRVTERSPAQKFCGALCRLALRRVLVREARWRRGGRRPAGDEPAISLRGP